MAAARSKAAAELPPGIQLLDDASANESQPHGSDVAADDLGYLVVALVLLVQFRDSCCGDVWTF